MIDQVEAGDSTLLMSPSEGTGVGFFLKILESRILNS
jgi:hypothetical protein